MFRVIIAGSRDFDNYDFLRKKMGFLLQDIKEEIVIICGMARGADLLGKRYAEENSYRVLEYPAQWDKYGKRAGYLRNIEMAENADALVAFWDGRSKGTKHMIDIAINRDLKVRVIKYNM